MDYKLTISYLVPASVYGTDYTLYFPLGSSTPEIKNWNTAKLGAQPAIEVLQQAWDSVLVQQARVAQLAILAAASSAAQTAGFTSSALGSVYTYPSGLQDQANLNAVATSSTFPIQPSNATFIFWCTNAAGVSGFTPHTAAQIQRVGMDALAAIMAHKSKQWQLSQEIAAATTIAEVQAVAW
jgi:hypothetical protein